MTQLAKDTQRQLTDVRKSFSTMANILQTAQQGITLESATTERPEVPYQILCERKAQQHFRNAAVLSSALKGIMEASVAIAGVTIEEHKTASNFALEARRQTTNG